MATICGFGAISSFLMELSDMWPIGVIKFINIHNNNQISFLGFANNTVRSPEHCQALAEPSKKASKPISNDRVATFMLYIQPVVTMQTSLVGLVLLAAIKLWLILD